MGTLVNYASLPPSPDLTVNTDSPLSQSPTRHPSSWKAELLLLSICMLIVGSHFGRHFISSLGPLLMQRLHISRSQYGLLFSGQEVPSIVLPLAGGLFISTLRLQYGPVAILLACIITAGQIITALAVSARSYDMLVIGRMTFGLADGALVVVQGAMVGKCFGQEKVSTAFGTTLLFSRFGSFLGFTCPAIFADHFGLSVAMWISSFVSVISFIAAVVYFRIERWNDRSDGLLYPPPSLPPNPVVCNRLDNLSSLFVPVIEFWCIVYVWSTMASAVFTFLHFGSDIASTELRLTHGGSVVGVVNGGLLLFSGFASPFVGLVQDKNGHRVAFLSGSLAICAAGLVCCAFSLDGEVLLLVVGLVMIALGFAIAPVTLLSCITLVVTPDQLPAALGFYKAVENIFLSLTHWLAGFIRDHSMTYQPTVLFLAMVSGTGAAVAATLYGTSKRDILEAAAADCRSAQNGPCGIVDEAVSREVWEEAI